MFTPDAHVDHTAATMSEICYSMKCRAPGRRGYYRAGPALEGTPCGPGTICEAGKCVTNTVSPGAAKPAAWSEWSAPGSCKSGCITRARGYTSKTRVCLKQSPVGVESVCPGPTTETALCSGASCTSTSTPQAWAVTQCRAFLKVVQTDLP